MIFIAAIFDQNLGIIAACVPTFQPLFRSFAMTVRSGGHKQYPTRNLSYKILPDKKGIRNDANEESLHLRTLASKPASTSNPQKDACDRENGFALDRLNPIQKHGEFLDNGTVDSKCEVPKEILYKGRADAV